MLQGLTKDLTNEFSILNGAKYLSSGRLQNYSIFILAKSDNYIAPTLADHNLWPNINFDGHCLINNISIHKKVLNLYIFLTF